MSERQILKSAISAPHAAREVLAMVLAEELVSPSSTLYLIAPWISNISIFDNTLGQFAGLNPEWGRREIRLIDVLVAIASNQTRLVCAVRPDPHNKPFETRLKAALNDAGVQERCAWSIRPSLHTKGMLTDGAFVCGSMNFTTTGIEVSDEALIVTFDREKIAQAKLEFAGYDEG